MLICDEVHPSMVGIYYRDLVSYHLYGLLWGTICHYGIWIQLAANFPDACWLLDAWTSLGYAPRFEKIFDLLPLTKY